MATQNEVFICPVCNIRVYPLEKGVTQNKGKLYHESCSKKEIKISMFNRFFTRGSPMVFFPKHRR